MENVLKVNQPTSKVEGKFFVPMNLQYFSDPTDGGDAPLTDPPATPPAGGQSDPPPSDPPADPPKSFTQEDVNGIAAKEARKAQEKLLKELGIEDFENAKDGLAKFREWQDSQKTEQQKQADRLKQLETNFTTTAEENADLKAQISAMKAGVQAESVADVVLLAKPMVNDDVDMEAAIAKVVEKYPHFAGQQEDKQGDGKPSFSTGQHKKQSQSLADQWAEAFK